MEPASHTTSVLDEVTTWPGISTGADFWRFNEEGRLIGHWDVL